MTLFSLLLKKKPTTRIFAKTSRFLSFFTLLGTLTIYLGSFFAKADISLESGHPIQLKRGLILESEGYDGTVYVKRGDVKAPLMKAVAEAKLSNNKEVLNLYNESCEAGGRPFEERTFNLDQMEARIENVVALRLHQAKKYEKAIPGFQKALKLDSHFEVAAYNLACALNLSGKTEEAVQVLSPFLKENLPKAYLAIIKDPELRSLLKTETIKALQTPGSAQLKYRDQNWAAFSEKHQLLAIYDPELGMRVYDLKTGKNLATWALGSEWFHYAGEGDVEELEKNLHAENRREWTKKSPIANQFLAQLGFIELTDKETGKLVSHIPKSKLGSYVESDLTFLRFLNHNLILSLSVDGIGRLRTGEQVATNFTLGRGRVFLKKGFYLPQIHSIVFTWKAPGGYECHRDNGTEAMINLQAP